MFFNEDRIPNEDAIALAPTIGWVMLATAVAVFAMFIAQSERWRRFWLTMEDPRPIAFFRILFAFLVICNVNDLWEYFEMLFTDEGIFFSDVARQVFAAGQFTGYGDGIGNDPKGFFDINGLLLFLKGPKYSPLFFWDSPTAWWTQWALFHLITFAFMVGWKTRTMGVLSFLMMNGIFLRNQLFWEGTELVYRVFFFYLILARSGHAWSVDNWLRCRKLKKQGLLSERGGPGGGAGVAPSAEHPKGLAAVYRLIPSWPRWLCVLNLAALYCYTGVVKNGAVWAKGDALYYALNMDHFYRYYPQQVAAVVGLTVFRLATWVTHWWEALFPVLIIGEVTRWALREQIAPLKGGKLWFVRAMWVFFGLGCGTTALISMPVHYVPGVALNLSTQEFQIFFGLAWLGLVAFLGGLWWVLGNKPPAVRIRGTRYPIDREWFCRWILGRRTWLTLGFVFHGNLNVMMNIGMFPPVMLSTYFTYFHGDETAKLLRFVGKRLPRWVPFIPEDVRRGEPPLPAEDRRLPHHIRDSQQLPEWLMYALVALAVAGVAAQVHGKLHFGWTALGIAGVLIVYTYAQGHARSKLFMVRMAGLLGAIGGLMWLFSRDGERWTATRAVVLLVVLAIYGLRKLVPAIDRGLSNLGFAWVATDAPKAPDLPLSDPHTTHIRAPWAYGPGGRMIVSALVIWHVTGVAVWLMPDKDCLHWRNEAKGVFREWLLYTSTDQSWGMFAPNPPRHNVFMRAVVIDNNDEKWDMRTDVYAPERKPIPWVWNDRMRKMNRRIIGGESGKGDWYQKWYARYLCRMWTMAHDGEPPKKVELFKISYRIPSPEEVTKKGWYVPEELLVESGEERRQYTENCRTGITAQVPNEHLIRHGIAPKADDYFKPWVKDRKKKWDSRHATRGIIKPSIERTKRTIAKAKVEARTVKAERSDTGNN